MRILMSAVVAASLFGSHLAAAAESCARPAERTAFDVAGLKSQLMVTALTCSADEKYNSFVARFRPTLINAEKDLNAYFSRTFGRRGQSQHDDYVTQLANSQSQTGLKQGNSFCNQSVGIFDEVAALRSPAELPDFASGKTLVQPVNYESCGGVSWVTRAVASHDPPAALASLTLLPLGEEEWRLNERARRPCQNVSRIKSRER